MIDPQLQELLVCPKCHGELDFEDRRTEGSPGIHCMECGAHYPVKGQIPLMFAATTNDGFGHDLYHAQLHGNFFERVFHGNRIETLLRLITAEIGLGPGARALDVGCNTGPMLIPLRQQGYNVVGIDISADDVQQAERYLCERDLPTDRLSVGDGTRLPFRDQSFDLVLLIDILEHTDHPERIVSEARRLLVPGGIAIATVPWAYHPYVRYTWLRKLLSSRKTIDEHPDAPFELEMLQSLFPSDFCPVCYRLVFHWVCILGVYRLRAHPRSLEQPEPGEATAAREPSATPGTSPQKEEPVPAC
jgi:SAM-dependent methyltransferase